jgi:hypothetical protein
VCKSEQCANRLYATLSYVTTPQLTPLQRLILQIERDLLAQAQLRALLTAADKTVGDNRQSLRTVKARIKRSPPRERHHQMP